eukprot:scaffold551697_cov46-Prasinocladus_malaysianus.AAC.1
MMHYDQLQSMNGCMTSSSLSCALPWHNHRRVTILVQDNFEELQMMIEDSAQGRDFMAPMVVLPDGDICGKTNQACHVPRLVLKYEYSYLDCSRQSTYNAAVSIVVLGS